MSWGWSRSVVKVRVRLIGDGTEEGTVRWSGGMQFWKCGQDSGYRREVRADGTELLREGLGGQLAEGGRLALVLDTGSVSRGSGNRGSNRERDIRAKFVERGLFEAVILLPENLFYNTSAPGALSSSSTRPSSVPARSS